MILTRLHLCGARKSVPTCSNAPWVPTPTQLSWLSRHVVPPAEVFVPLLRETAGIVMNNPKSKRPWILAFPLPHLGSHLPLHVLPHLAYLSTWNKSMNSCTNIIFLPFHLGASCFMRPKLEHISSLRDFVRQWTLETGKRFFLISNTTAPARENLGRM